MGRGGATNEKAGRNFSPEKRERFEGRRVQTVSELQVDHRGDGVGMMNGTFHV